MLTSRKTTDNDFLLFAPSPDQLDEFSMIREIFYGYDKENCLTVLDGDNPVLLIGMREKWHKVYDTFTIYSASWKPVYFKSFVKIAKDYFSNIDYDRIEHLISCDRPWTDKTARFFGFKYNTTFKKYINGKDYKLYEIVR